MTKLEETLRAQQNTQSLHLAMTAELVRMIEHCQNEIKRLEAQVIALLMEKAGATVIDHEPWSRYEPNIQEWMNFAPTEGGKKDGE